MAADPTPSRRERQAQATRDEILQAARRLFAERGYARTSVRDVAQAAGVSAQTVYDSVGSKRALVARLNDLIDQEAGIVAIAMGIGQVTDPVEVVSTSARVTRSILEHCGDVVRALVSGAVSEPDLAAVLAEGQRRHVDGAQRVIARLHELKALPKRADREAMATALAALSDVRYALVLQDGYGWSLDEIEQWMARAADALVLGSGAGR